MLGHNRSGSHGVPPQATGNAQVLGETNCEQCCGRSKIENSCCIIKITGCKRLHLLVSLPAACGLCVKETWEALDVQVGI